MMTFFAGVVVGAVVGFIITVTIGVCMTSGEISRAEDWERDRS